MNRKEALRLTRQSDVLQSLGFTADEAESLRRISMTLRRWHEMECGIDIDNGRGHHVSVSVERDGDEPDSKPFKRIQYMRPNVHGVGSGEWVDKRFPIPDRETGAKKRLNKIIAARNARSYVNGKCQPEEGIGAYIQTDPRGAALYIIRPGDVPEGSDVSSCYTRGICVY